MITHLGQIRESSSSRSKEITQSGFREPTFEMKSSKPRSQVGRSLRVPAELDFHLSTCHRHKREVFSRCGTPLAEEGFAIAGIKNASSVSPVTFREQSQLWTKRNQHEEQQRLIRATRYRLIRFAGFKRTPK